MLIKKRKEVEFVFLNYSTLRFIILRKNIKEIKDLNTFKFLSTRLVFKFRDVINISEIRLFNHFLFVFLITNKIAFKIINFNSSLRLGIRYYKWQTISGFKINFDQIDFISNYLLIAINKRYKKEVETENLLNLRLDSLDIVTNLKLSTGFYFNSIKEPIYIQINSTQIKKNLIKSLLKWDYIIG